MSAHAAIHTGLRQLGLDQDAARDLYARVTGKRSLREMSDVEQQRVVEELRRQGFAKSSSGSRKRLEGRFAPKLQALWISAWNLGLIHNRDDHALVAFVKRQTGVDHVRFLRYPEDAAAAIEALKGWMAREAGVDWQADRFLPDWTQTPGYRIAAAQMRILKARDPKFSGFTGLQQWLVQERGQQAHAVTDWASILNELGRAVRKVR